MAEFKIEKGVPMPEARDGKRKYPFPDMAVGDSFLVPGVDGRRLSSSATLYGRRNGKTFCTRKVDGGVRVWRVA